MCDSLLDYLRVRHGIASLNSVLDALGNASPNSCAQLCLDAFSDYLIEIICPITCWIRITQKLSDRVWGV